MANLASSLILHKRIKTTVAKAKELRKYIEPLITKAKNDTTHSRRTVFTYLKHKDPVRVLFSEVAGKVADRPGGYTRILRTGNRLGDNAEMCIMELVDFNETYTGGKKAAQKTRRRRGGAKKKGAEETVAVEAAAPEAAVPKAGRKKKAAPAEEAPKAAEPDVENSATEGETEATE
jgi:large subunit ribosomal protein L17